MEHYKHEFFKRNNLDYTFKIESMLNIGKIHIVAYKRERETNKRIDMAEFFLDYPLFLAILKSLRMAFKNKKEYKIDLTGGEDGKRKLYINLKFKPFSLGFKLIDSILPEKDIKFKDYTGRVGFVLKSMEDVLEFFGLEETIRSWELANINHIINDGFKK